MMKRPVIIFLLFPCLTYAQHQSSYAQNSPSYPVVNSAEQKARDDDRRLILEAELRAERQEQVKAQAALAAGPTKEREADFHRHSENVKALERELAGMTEPAPRAPVRVVVKAKRPTVQPETRGSDSIATFWNPYNRAPDPDLSADLSTTPVRRDTP